MRLAHLYPRLRTAVTTNAKWGGLVVTVLLLVVWVGSVQWMPIWVPRRGIVSIEKGQIKILGPLVIRQPRDLWTNWSLNPTDGEFRWWFRSERVSMAGDQWFLGIPCWLTALLSLLATAASWRADLAHRHRARAGMCSSCNYDRAGLAPNAVCPECGSLPKSN